MCFYLLPARLFVRLDPAPATGDARTWTLGIAATTVKGYEIFEEQFIALVEALRGTDAAPAGAAHPAGAVAAATT